MSISTACGSLLKELQVCPFLVCTFPKRERHNKPSNYSLKRKKVPRKEIEIYCWMDSKLSDITDEIVRQCPDEFSGDKILSFALVYPDRNSSHLLLTKVAICYCHSRGRPDSRNMTLTDICLQIGDYLDVAIIDT